ncbi:hypothetical protein QFZ74_000232 [Streptomyces sp. V3I7]|nr:hypothetical protein [Streptomyces sp. V3I7]
MNAHRAGTDAPPATPRALFPQMAAETYMQGVMTVVVVGGPRLADIAHGTAGAAFGPRAAVAGGGLLVVPVTLILAATVPALRRYRI